MLSWFSVAVTRGTTATSPLVWICAVKAIAPFRSPRTGLPMRIAAALVLAIAGWGLAGAVWLGVDSIGRQAVEKRSAAVAATDADR